MMHHQPLSPGKNAMHELSSSFSSCLKHTLTRALTHWNTSCGRWETRQSKKMLTVLWSGCPPQ